MVSSDETVSAGTDPAHLYPMFYPDVAAAGSLRNALQAELVHAGQALEAIPERSPGWRYVGARVEDEQRQTSVLMGIQERVFLMEFWDQGVRMAWGNTDDLRAVTGAIVTWHAGSRVRDLGSAWPFVKFGPFAEAHERGEAAEHEWQQYYENTGQAPQLSRLHSFIAAAIHEPRLRALLPFTSMGTLGFSRTVGYPYSDDCPWVTPTDDDCYVVQTHDGRELGTADAAGSVALVLAALDAATAS
jgi:Family of unknown function (DUF6193)